MVLVLGWANPVSRWRAGARGTAPRARGRHARGAAERCPHCAKRVPRCGVRRRPVRAAACWTASSSSRISPGLAPRAATWPLIAAARERGIPRVGRDRAVRAGARRAQARARLRAESDRDHRHQRQDHGDQPDRPAVRARRPDVRGGRQHQPGRCWTRCAKRIDTRARCREVLGARAVELPAATRRCRLAARRRHRAEHHAGPPRLARRHGRLCRRQGAHLRHAAPCACSIATTRA